MNTRKFSKNQEDKVAKQLKGKRVSNSGATPFHKGDVSTDGFLIECKTMMTEKNSMSIKKEWIDKQKQEAFAMGKENWAIAFNFGGILNKDNFYIIDERTFKELIELKKE